LKCGVDGRDNQLSVRQHHLAGDLAEEHFVSVIEEGHPLVVAALPLRCGCDDVVPAAAEDVHQVAQGREIAVDLLQRNQIEAANDLGQVVVRLALARAETKLVVIKVPNVPGRQQQRVIGTLTAYVVESVAQGKEPLRAPVQPDLVSSESPSHPGVDVGHGDRAPLDQSVI
jgi:hypothetical protein